MRLLCLFQTHLAEGKTMQLRLARPGSFFRLLRGHAELLHLPAGCIALGQPVTRLLHLHRVIQRDGGGDAGAGVSEETGRLAVGVGEEFLVELFGLLLCLGEGLKFGLVLEGSEIMLLLEKCRPAGDLLGALVELQVAGDALVFADHLRGKHAGGGVGGQDRDVTRLLVSLGERPLARDGHFLAGLGMLQPVGACCRIPLHILSRGVELATVRCAGSNHCPGGAVGLGTVFLLGGAVGIFERERQRGHALGLANDGGSVEGLAILAHLWALQAGGGVGLDLYAAGSGNAQVFFALFLSQLVLLLCLPHLVGLGGAGDACGSV